MIRPISLIILIPMLCVAASPPLSAENRSRNSYFAWEEKSVDEIIGGMNNTQLLGQVFLLGYLGKQPSDEILSWIREREIGGVKIFGWNVSDLETLAGSIADMQKEALATPGGIPLLVATDQEGGWVRHIKDKTSITPGALSIGATTLPYDAYKTGYYIGSELRALGVNMNFAPTIDVYSNPKTDVIGPRSFSSDPVQVGVLGQAFFKGLEEIGVIATAKHFPGHGNAEEDSHGTLPIIEDSLDTIRNRELVPYRFLISEGIPAIMSGHLGFPEITGHNKPASLSHELLVDLLRRDMGFEGVIVTDDLQMHGAYSGGLSFPMICEQAVRAGNNLLMISRNETDKEEAWKHLLDLMKRDPEFKFLITDSARRILLMKKQYLGEAAEFPIIPSIEAIDDAIPSGKEFYRQQAYRSITLIKGQGLPLDPAVVAQKKQKILLAGQFTTFFEAGKEFYSGAKTYRLSYTPFYSPRADEMAALKKLARETDKIIFCLATPGSYELLKELEPFAEKIIVVSALTPVYLTEISWVQSAIAVYGTGGDSFHAGFAALAGEFIPRGILPVDFSGKQQ